MPLRTALLLKSLQNVIHYLIWISGEIRELAKKFTPEQIDGCITQQLDTGKNICLRDKSTEKVVSELSRAQFVRELMRQGVDMSDAI